MKQLLLVASIIVSSCLFINYPAKAADKVTLQLRWENQSQFAGYYAAKWQGYYKEAGLEVEIKSAIKPNREILSAVNEVAEGRADFGVGAADILLGIDKGFDLSVLAVIFQQSAACLFYRENTRINSLADLTRLRVARQVNSLIDIELQAMLRSEGIDPASVQPLKHIPGLDRLVNGQIDVMPAYSISMHFNEQSRGMKLKSLKPSTYGVDFYGDSLFTHRRLTKNNPEMVKKFVAASLKGWKYALDHPEEIADKISRDLTRYVLIENRSTFNRLQIKGVKDLTLYPIVELGHINPGRWRRMNEFLKGSGIVKGDLDLGNVIFDPVRQRQEFYDKIIKVITVSFLTVILISVLFFVWIYSLRKTVNLRTKELRKLSLDFFHAQEEERKRIGSELHNGLAQSLGAIKIWAETAQNNAQSNDVPKILESMQKIVPITQGTIEEVRRISRNLHPSVLDNFGILASLNALLEEFRLTHEGINFIDEIQIEDDHVLDSLKFVIYRVLQEALNNVVKHSQATLVRICLTKSNTKINLTIDDNGCGFEPEDVVSSKKVGRGLGLTSMRERITLTGGSFSIESQELKGTVLQASWPYGGS
jgi:signal transduction histidine kinase/ABC-type taurine transport system substrate-binding protein